MKKVYTKSFDEVQQLVKEGYKIVCMSYWASNPKSFEYVLEKKDD